MSLVEKALHKLKTGSGPGQHPSPGDPLPAVEAMPDRAEPSQPSATLARPARPRFIAAGKPIAIDINALRAKEMLPPKAEERQLADQLRIIKRPLIRHAFGEPAAAEPRGPSPRSIMITSALPGDGKTFTALNLAMSMAHERDYSVVLVDADVAKRDISHMLGLTRATGLLDVLADPARPIESAIVATDYQGLSVLPAGRVSETATELLASARMTEVINSLMALDSRCLVILDSPPILLTTEAPILASLFGQIVVVVRAGGTPRRAVLEAVKIIGSAGRVSLVLNRADVVGPSGYHYDYGHRYGEQGPGTGSGRDDE